MQANSWRYQFGKKNLTSEFFLFQVRRLETLVPKNHFVREVAPFPRSGHIIFIVYDKGQDWVVYLKSVENVITLGKLIGLLFLFCLPLLSILILKTPKIRGMTSLAL